MYSRSWKILDQTLEYIWTVLLSSKFKTDKKMKKIILDVINRQQKNQWIKVKPAIDGLKKF